uniref:Uncharacterized protein n=1 Tax=Cacopsylla melanoneura TaxID=428564 RepID=A0A8D9BP92_9HEMI
MCQVWFDPIVQNISTPLTNLTEVAFTEVVLVFDAEVITYRFPQMCKSFQILIACIACTELVRVENEETYKPELSHAHVELVNEYPAVTCCWTRTGPDTSP